MTAVPFLLDPEPEPEAAEAGRLLFAGPCDFVKGVVALDGLPPADRVEVCFAGRSNVGKSSLINALTGRKGLARASNTPGRTQELNYFALGDRLYMVDLPGYGYAKAPKDKVAAWQALLRAYLAGRVSLRRVFVLIDSRHGVKSADHEIMALLDTAAVSFQAVLTKADKKGAALTRTVEAVKTDLARHPTAYPEILTTSAETGQGLDRLRAAIYSLA
ncbi:MAG: ribosome biogenesis GTP-binding protein YihA/YsxC [Pseudomonadota bacterium]